MSLRVMIKGSTLNTMLITMHVCIYNHYFSCNVGNDSNKYFVLSYSNVEIIKFHKFCQQN